MSPGRCARERQGGEPDSRGAADSARRRQPPPPPPPPATTNAHHRRRPRSLPQGRLPRLPGPSLRASLCRAAPRRRHLPSRVSSARASRPPTPSWPRPRRAARRPDAGARIGGADQPRLPASAPWTRRSVPGTDWRQRCAGHFATPPGSAARRWVDRLRSPDHGRGHRSAVARTGLRGRGLALSVPLAAGFFSHRITRSQVLAVLLIAASLAALPIGFSTGRIICIPDHSPSA